MTGRVNFVWIDEALDWRSPQQSTAAQEGDAHTMLKCQNPKCGRKMYGADYAEIDYRLIVVDGKLRLVCPACCRQWERERNATSSD